MSSNAPTPHEHANSTATRLLSAGAYLESGYRAAVKELLTDPYRIVAPSYGYDAVPVLAHALAADRLRRSRRWAFTAGTALVVVFLAAGAMGPTLAFFLILWLWWATAYLRRIATLQMLIRLKGSPAYATAAYPTTPQLTVALVRKINREQASDSGVVHYSGYRPFVGAGRRVHRWSNAELLIGAPYGLLERTGLLDRDTAGPADAVPLAPANGDGAAPEARERKPIIPFTVDDLTSYVAARMNAELYEEAPQHERIASLTVERRRYATAIRTDTPRPGGPWTADPEGVHWREDYDSAREYLCVRVGSWNQELVTSMFVGFDIKGNTLHTEFYTYVLAPIMASFHLLDRLPDALDDGLMWRAALAGGTTRQRLGKAGAKLRGAVDTSELKLERFAKATVDSGAFTSVRELATAGVFHHFFQESDTIKYTEIVERRLLKIMRDFLHEHNVDLADHEAQQTNVLNQNFGDTNTNNNYGGGTMSVGNRGNQTFGGGNSPAGAEATAR